MNLTPTEMERLTIFQVAELARHYKKEGVKLSLPEAQALIADEILLAARKGLDHHELVSLGQNILNHEDVYDGVPLMMRSVSVEVSMEEGTKLVTIFDPIHAPIDTEVRPGELFLAEKDIKLNEGRKAIEISVTNTGDRSIQVRSHAHFFEVNKALKFDRRQSLGMRLDRPSGGGERFDPGIKKSVKLVPYGGTREVYGFAGLTNGSIDNPNVTKRAIVNAKARGYFGDRK